MASDAKLVKLHREWYHFDVIDRRELQTWTSEIKNLLSEIKAEEVDDATLTQILNAKHGSLKSQFEAKMKDLQEIVNCQEYMITSLTESTSDLAPRDKEQVISSLILLLSGARRLRDSWLKVKPNLIMCNQVANRLQENKRWLEQWALWDLEMRHVEA